MLRPPSFAWSEVHRISVTPPRFVALAERGRPPCGSWVYHNWENGAVAIFRCKSWRCPQCAPRRKGQFIARVAQLLEGWDRVRFWTLTLAPDLIPQNVEAEKWLLSAWRKLRVHLGRRCPRCNRRARRNAKAGRKTCSQHPGTEIRTPSFVWVLEYTKAGIPHLHVAVNQYVPRPWLQAKWEGLTGAWNVDLRELRDVQDATKYLAKYLGKTLQIVESDEREIVPRLRGVHIYGSSKDMPITPPKRATTWELIRDPEGVAALLVPPEKDVLLLQMHGLDPAAELLRPSWPAACETAREGTGAPETASAEETPPKNRREPASPSIPEEGPGPPAGGRTTYRGRCWTCGYRVFASDPWTVADLMAAHVEEVHPT